MLDVLDRSVKGLSYDPPASEETRHRHPPTDGSGVLPDRSLQHHTIKRYLRYAVVLFAWRCVTKLASLSYSTRSPMMLNNELYRPPSLTFMLAVSAQLRLCVTSYILFYGMPAQQRTAQDGPNSYVPGGALHAPALRVGRIERGRLILDAVPCEDVEILEEHRDTFLLVNKNLK
jgi:hypothetical protein